MKNIILIGMPGCGKTTIGKQLANRLNLSFFDCDTEIVKRQGKSIDQIFREQGEVYFRNLETKLLEALPTDNFVISTGGGIIENQKNVKLLRENGTVIFINRPIENILKDIDTSHRPLLKDDKSRLSKLYKRRIDIYKSASHFEVENADTLQYVITKIIDEVKKNG